MPKKAVKKKVRAEMKSGLPDFKDFDSKKTISKKSKAIKESANDTEKLLLENFIALQEALVTIGSDLKDLNKKITSMLELFENASRAYEEKPESRSLSNKLNEIIEQNQTIAKSILLLSKKFKEGKEEKEEKFDLKSMKNEMPEFEGFKPSIKSESQEEESNKSSDSSEETKNPDESSEDSGDDDEFTPEPLPDFNF